jgi:REP element-mobilizing transposase RayT
MSARADNFIAFFKMARRSKQLELQVPPGWGGARRGAGRPVMSGRRRPVPHRTRPEHAARFPVHVTLRAASGLPSLRGARVFGEIRAAIAAAFDGHFRVIQFSVQSDHIHTIVEADDRSSLSAGLRGFVIRVARAVNRALGRTGVVWGDRYHARAVRTPREARGALLYVLQNWKKHIRGATGIDGRSSAPWFDGWTKTPRAQTTPSPVSRPRTWLASRGWRERGGGRLRPEEAPATGRG